MPPPDQKYKVLIDRLVNHKIDWTTNPPGIYLDAIIPKAARPAFFRKLLGGKSDVFDELKKKFDNPKYDPELPRETSADDFDDISDVFEEIESDTNNQKAYELLREAIIGLLYKEYSEGEMLCKEVKKAIEKYPDLPDLVNALHRICEHRRTKTIHDTY